LLISPTRTSTCVKKYFQRHKSPAQELEVNNSRFIHEIGQLELQEKVASKFMQNTGFVCSNTSITATKLSYTLKNTTCTNAAHSYVIYFLFSTNFM
jgi:hypothetical protein